MTGEAFKNAGDAVVDGAKTAYNKTATFAQQQFEGTKREINTLEGVLQVILLTLRHMESSLASPKKSQEAQWVLQSLKPDTEIVILELLHSECCTVLMVIGCNPDNTDTCAVGCAERHVKPEADGV